MFKYENAFYLEIKENINREINSGWMFYDDNQKVYIR